MFHHCKWDCPLHCSHFQTGSPHQLIYLCKTNVNLPFVRLVTLLLCYGCWDELIDACAGYESLEVSVYYLKKLLNCRNVIDYMSKRLGRRAHKQSPAECLQFQIKVTTNF